MRGKLNRVWIIEGMDRLIPAHAGKTAQIDAKAAELGAHPRACGENLRLTDRTLSRPGSSPRMRGKHGRQARPQAKHGLIPAHAGKTFSEIKD